MLTAIARPKVDLSTLGTLTIATVFTVVSSYLPLLDVPSYEIPRVEFAELALYEVLDVGSIEQQTRNEFIIGGNLAREFHRRDLGISQMRDQEEYPALYFGKFNPKAKYWSAAAFIQAYLFAQNAEARHISGGAGGSAPTSCPQGTFTNPTGQSDGCPGAPTGTANNSTLYQRTNFFTSYAPQSGQNYGSTRPGWNVAGVDYPVGIPGGTVFVDPATTSGTVCPTGISGSLSPTCNYNPTGNLLGGPRFQMASSGGTLTNTGMDYSGNLVGSHGCVTLELNASYPSTFTLQNSYFAVNAGCFGNSNRSCGAEMLCLGAPGNFNLLDNTFDFSPVWTGAGFKPVGVAPTGQFLTKYNSFHNIPENPFNGNPSNFGMTQEYNLFDSWTFSGTPNQNHSEITDLNGAGTRSTYYWLFNTMMKSNLAGLGTGTAFIWVSAATANGSIFTDNQVRNNTMIENCNAAAVSGGGSCPVGSGTGSADVDNVLISFQSNTFTNSAVTDNYVDITGTLNGMAIAAGATCTNPITWSGNIALWSGATISKVAGLVNSGSTGC